MIIRSSLQIAASVFLPRCLTKYQFVAKPSKCFLIARSPQRMRPFSTQNPKSNDNDHSAKSLTFDWEQELTGAEIQKLALIKNEFSVWQNADVEIPDESIVRKHDWLDVLQLQTGRERLMFWTFLARRGVLQTKCRSDKKKLLRQELRENLVEDDEVFFSGSRTEKEMFDYSYGHNSFLQRIQRVVISKWNKQRWPSVTQLNPKIVMDLSLMSEISDYRNINLTTKQLMYSYIQNCHHRQPCDLIFAGYDRQAKWARFMDRRFYPSGLHDYPMCTVSEKPAWEMFPREKLIYLSPDAPSSVQKFDSDKVYVIGAMVDKTPHLSGVSLGLTKRLEIECQKLPLDVYLDWEVGHKGLAINHVLQILLDAHMTGDWRSSLLASVPARRLKPVSALKTTIHRSHTAKVKQRIDFLLSLTEVG